MACYKLKYPRTVTIDGVDFPNLRGVGFSSTAGEIDVVTLELHADQFTQDESGNITIVTLGKAMAGPDEHA